METKQDDGGSLWVATCSDGFVVVFHRVVKEGDGVYFTPYWEGDDGATKHGYIKRIEDIL